MINLLSTALRVASITGVGVVIAAAATAEEMVSDAFEGVIALQMFR